MSEQERKNSTTEPSKTNEDTPKSIVEALLDLGASWAAHGLNAGKFSLENSARALEKTAKTLEGLAREFEKKSGRKNEAV
jgi:hypothetical protein